jgi:hypothetical protein
LGCTHALHGNTIFDAPHFNLHPALTMCSSGTHAQHGYFILDAPHPLITRIMSPLNGVRQTVDKQHGGSPGTVFHHLPHTGTQLVGAPDLRKNLIL